MDEELTCGDPEIENALLRKESCCDSCHEDWDEGGMDMVRKTIVIDNVERNIHVCCATNRALNGS